MDAFGANAIVSREKNPKKRMEEEVSKGVFAVASGPRPGCYPTLASALDANPNCKVTRFVDFRTARKEVRAAKTFRSHRFSSYLIFTTVDSFGKRSTLTANLRPMLSLRMRNLTI